MFSRRLPFFLVVLSLAMALAGCKGGGQEAGTNAPGAPVAGAGGVPPDMGAMPPGSELAGAPAGPEAIGWQPDMAGMPGVGGAPGMGGMGGAPQQQALPPARGAAADLENAKTLLAMGDVFMKYYAYDLALAAYQDSARFEPATRAQALRMASLAARELRNSFKRPKPIQITQRRRLPGYGAQAGYAGYGAEMGAGPYGLPMGAEAGLQPLPGMEQVGMGPAGVPEPMMMGTGGGYQIPEAPPVPPTAMGF